MKKKLLLLLIGIAAFALPVQPCVATAETRLIIDRQYYPCALNAIREAKKTINLAIFQIRYYPKYPESPSNLLIESLISAAKRGVEVEVCIERSEGYNEETNAFNLESAKRLAANKVKVYLDNPEKTMHAKFLVVDGRLVLLGSTNWSYYSLNFNRETNVMVESKEMASQLLQYFSELKKESALLEAESQ